MAKSLTKHANIIEQLHGIVRKQAEAQDKVVGKPGKDTDIEALSDGTESTNKNDVGPEKLNDKQKYKQEGSSDDSEPSKATKTAEEIAQDFLDTVKAKLAETNEKQALAQTDISGVPGKDGKQESLPDETETTDKNNVGPDKLNNEQGYEQKPATNKSEPVKATKSASDVSEIAAKVASFNLGEQWAEQFIKAAASAQQPQVNTEMLKQAGRHDFDIMIAQAAANLEAQQGYEKQAEDAGAGEFERMYKEAQLALAIEEIQTLRSKVAEFEKAAAEQQAEFEKQAAAKAQAELAATIAKQAAEQAVAQIKELLQSEQPTTATK